MTPTTSSLTLRIRCVDKRYATAAGAQTLHDALGEGAYEFTAPGASLAALDDTWRQWLRRQVKLLQSANIHPQVIQIVDHFSTAGAHGCAAYGADDSRVRHERNLRAAAVALTPQPEFKGCTIQLYLHDLDAGTIETL